MTAKFDEASADRLATVKVARLDIPTLVSRMGVDKQALYRRAQERDPAFMAEIARAFRKLEKAALAVRRSSAANVSTDNATGILEVVRPIVLAQSQPLMTGNRRHSDSFVRWLTDQVKLSPADLAVVQRPGRWMTLDGFHRLLYAAWILDGRADSVFRFAMHMLRSGSRSAVGELILAVQPLDMQTALDQIGLAMGFYNDTKDGEVVFSADDHALLRVTIKEGIRPEDDYLSRFFALCVITHNMPWVIWEPYLEEIVGYRYDDILKEYLEAHVGQFAHPTDPSTVVGDVFTEGVWRWWLDQHPDFTQQFGLPRQIRFAVDSVCEQFPLYEALRFHQRLARGIPMRRDDHPATDGILWSHDLVDVRESGPVLTARVHGQVYVIAHRVKLIGTHQGRPIWRELEPDEPWIGCPYAIDRTVALCHSPEWGGRIDICTYYRRENERQLWEMPFSLWALSWRNPPKPEVRPTTLQSLRMRVDRLRRSRRGALRTIGGAVVQFALTKWRKRPRSLRSVRQKMERQLSKVRDQMAKATIEYLELLATAGNDFEEFQRRFDEILERNLDESNRKHIQRLTDLGWLFIAWLMELPPEQFQLLLLEPKNLPGELRKDTRFHVSFQVVQILRFAFKVHDTGKIFLPEEVLNTAHPSQAAIEFLKSHVDLGWSVLKPLYPVMRFWVIIALLHHENEDGSGYPWGLNGEQIPMLAKILRILDVFDAMQGDRPYRTPYFCTLAQVLRGYLNSMKRGQIHRPLTVLFCRFLRWLRDHLVQLPVETLRDYGLSEPIVEFFHGTFVCDMQTYPFAEVEASRREAVRAQYMADQAAESTLFEQIEQEFGSETDEFEINLGDWLTGQSLDLDAITAARPGR